MIMAFSRFILVLILATVVGMPAGLVAQTPPATTTSTSAAPPSAVTQMRQEFEAGVLKSTVVLNEYYERRLASLEVDLAAEGDYTQAKLVKQRRDELVALGKTVANGAGVPSIPISVETAKVNGIQARNGELSGWHTSTATADWSLTKIQPGPYRIELTYSMESATTSAAAVRQPVDEAEFVFREVSLLASPTKNVVSFKLVGNKGVMGSFQVPGLLQVTRPPLNLRLSPTGNYPLNSISIRDIKLVPVFPTSDPPAVAATAPDITPAAGFQKLRKQQEVRLLTARKPIAAEYLADLTQLAIKAKDDALETIEAEQRRVTKLQASATFTKINTSGLEGYDDIADVRFVPDATNTGDTFKVEHNGEKFKIRLAWVACPPMAPDDKRRLKGAMDHFGVDETVALYVGSSAKEFTELYLQARPLHLLLKAKQTKAKNEPQLALVFLEDIGMYQNVLIDNGFAIVDPPTTATKSVIEAAMVKSLQEREQAARKSESPLGGWVFGTKGNKTAR